MVNKRTKKANNRKAASNRKSAGNGNRARRARVQALRAGPGRFDMSIRHLAESLVDPFNASACVPDGAAGVGCFSNKQMFSLASNGTTGSFAGIAWGADVNAQVYAMTPTDFTVPSILPATTWSSAAQVTTMNDLYAKWRPVSAGIKATYTGSTINDSGVLLIGQVSGAVPLGSFNNLTLTQSAQLCMNYMMYPVRNGACITWKPTEFDHISEWEVFDAVADSHDVGDATARPYLIVFGYGMAVNGAGQLSIEVIANYEGAYKSQTFMPGGLSAIPSVPAVDSWYEKLQRLTQNISAIAPVVGSAINGYNRAGILGVIGTLSNGLPAPGRLGATGLPRLL